MYAQPIPGPSTVAYDDQNMSFSPSARYSYNIGSFNAAAQFLPTGCSPGTLLGPLDVPSFQQHRRGASYDQHAASFVHMLSTSVGKTDPQAGDMSRDYTCCGLRLSDLHALVEHFEERHVVVVDDPNFNFANFAAPMPQQQQQQQQYHVAAQEISPSYGQQLQSQLQSQAPQPHHYSQHFSYVEQPIPSTFQTLAQQPLLQDLDLDIEPMEDMDIDDGSSSSSRAHSVSSASTPGPSPPLTPILPFDTTAVRVAGVGAGITPGVVSPGSAVGLRLETAFNRYANYTEFSAMLPGTLNSSTLNSPAAVSAADWMTHSRQKSKAKGCITPAQLVSPTVSSPPSPSSSAPASPHLHRAVSHPASAHPPTRSQTLPNLYSPPAPHAGGNTNPLSKPFTCPRPNCTKSYKQANGLKYHLLHGSCSYTPPDPSLESLSPLEVEKRLKPYKCQVEGSGCERRYKNMNGLRYHYAHSGLHGEIGMRILMGQQAAEQKEKAARTAAIMALSASPSASSSRNPSPRPQFQPPQQILPYPLQPQPQHPSHLREQMA